MACVSRRMDQAAQAVERLATLMHARGMLSTTTRLFVQLEQLCQRLDALRLVAHLLRVRVTARRHEEACSRRLAHGHLGREVACQDVELLRGTGRKGFTQSTKKSIKTTPARCNTPKEGRAGGRAGGRVGSIGVQRMVRSSPSRAGGRHTSCTQSRHLRPHHDRAKTPGCVDDPRVNAN